MTRGGAETPRGGGTAPSAEGWDITADATTFPGMTNGSRIHLEALEGTRGNGHAANGTIASRG